MLRQQQSGAALYLRLSRDDGGDAQSNSIGNQRLILQRYARESGFDISGEYVDDGISGTTFERPSFKRMVTDIKDGKIGIVICKDLSRLGRNNAMVAYYTEIFFPENRVRFIAVNDRIDTFAGENEIMPFKSVINEFYARDISKKVRSAYKAQAQKGHYTGAVPPYGYLKDPTNRHRLIPNPETAPIIKRMYAMAASGAGASKIARTLRNEGILNPTAYSVQVLGINRQRTYKDDTDWFRATVSGILKSKVYLGHMVSQKSSTVSFKSRTQIKYPQEDHIIVRSTHQPLVEQEEYDLAQKIFGIKRPGNKHGIENIFVGVLKCSDCGSGLAMQCPGGKANPIFSYVCNRYRQQAKYCTTHYIRHQDIHKLVLESIRDKQEFVKAHKDELALYVQTIADMDVHCEQKQLSIELEKNRKRSAELDVVLSKLFERLALGDITEDRFAALSSEFDKERVLLKNRISDLQNMLSDKNTRQQNAMKLFELTRRHVDITELSRKIIYTLIEDIVIYQAQGKRKDRTQKVVINFRFTKDKCFF